MSVRPVRRENLPAGIAAELRRRILEGKLDPGARLPGHRELAALYSVSVGSVREAISMLISAGLVETRAGRGTYVADGLAGDALAAASTPPLDRREVEELIEAREVIEVQLAGLAAERASAEQVAVLRAAADRIAAAYKDAQEYGDADVEFHLALAEAAGNRYLLRALRDVRAQLKVDMELAAEVAIRRFGDLGFSVEAHRRLVDAIAARDAAGAREILTAMVRRNREAVLGLYALGPPGAGEEPA